MASLRRAASTGRARLIASLAAAVLATTGCGGERPVADATAPSSAVDVASESAMPAEGLRTYEARSRARSGFEGAARRHLGERYGGFWLDGSGMVLAVVGGATEEDVAALERHADGFPHRFVAVDTAHGQLQQVVDELSTAPEWEHLWEHLTMAGVDVPGNHVDIGVGSRSRMEEVERILVEAYPDIRFQVEFALPPQPLGG
jgi:hypothetical protein